MNAKKKKLETCIFLVLLDISVVYIILEFEKANILFILIIQKL
jgi:hypothetical protein